jgi:hypothetical protein
VVTPRALGIVPILVLATGGGCVWTEFDQLRDDVWVDSIGAIDGSSNFGEVVAEASMPPAGAGATIGVLGRNSASVSFVTYTADGTREIQRVDIGNSFTLVSAFDEHPVYAADPATDAFAVAALTGDLTADPMLRGLRIGIFHGATFQGVNPGYEPTAGFYVPPNPIAHEPPTAIGFGLDGGEVGPKVLLGRKGQLVRVALGLMTPGIWSGCHFTDPTEAAYAIGFGDVDGVPGGEWIIASAPVGIDVNPDPGRVWIVPATDPTVFNDATGGAPCPTPTKQVMDQAASIPLGAGSQIAVADFGAGPRVLVSSPGVGGKLSVIDFTATPATVTQIATAGVNDIDSFVVADITAANPGLEIIVGAPNASDAGPTRAGAVRVLKPDATAAAEPLHDADPETEQHFGKSVAVVPFGDKKVLVVGAEGEVFTYFRTTFYDEVRSGRTP